MADPPLLERIPPQNLDAERAVLGGMMLDPSAANIAVDLLTPDDFYPRRHQRIFKVLAAITDKGDPTDILVVESRLVSRGWLEEAGGPDYLRDLLGAVPSAANIEYYAAEIRSVALRRALIRSATVTLTQAYEGTDLEELIEFVDKEHLRMAKRRPSGGLQTMQDAIMAALDQIEKEDGLKGLQTEFYDYDRLSGGLKPGSLNIVVGLPSIGKSTFCQNLTLKIANVGNAVGVFLLEGTKNEYILRALSCLARVPLQAEEAPVASEYGRLLEAGGELSQLPLYIDDDAGLTVSNIRSRARAVHNEHTLRLLIVDYLQLVRGPGKIYERISEATEGLKNLAKELAIPVIAISQFSREAYKGARPQVHHLKGSGDIEQHADTILILHPSSSHEVDCQDVAGEEKVRHLTGYLDKNRNGLVGQFSLAHHKTVCRMESALLGPDSYF